MSLRKAASLIGKSRPVEAAVLISQVLERFPGNKRAVSLLADINKRAKASVSKDLFIALNSLLRGGKMLNVLEMVKNLPPMAFGLAELQVILGQAHAALGQRSQAVEHFDLATKLQPHAVAFWMAAGNDAFLTNDFARAEKCYEAALQIEPTNPDVINNLGMSLAGLTKFDAAEAIFAKAADLHPTNAKIAYNRANSFRDAGRLNEAIDNYRRAIALEPSYATAANNLGTVLHQLGRDQEAEAAYLQAVAAQPSYAQAHRNLSAVHRYTPDDPLIPEIDKQLSRANSDRDKMYLSFARFKAYEDCGDYARAFDYLTKANAIRKQLLGYSIENDRLLFATIKRMFSQPPSALPSESLAKPRPIFVLGMMRSGTTLVEQIISSHSAVHGAGELEHLGALCLPLMEQYHLTGECPSASDLEKTRRAYLSELRKVSNDAPVLTDKMPANFLWIGFILTCLPEARIVHMRRDPIATCWSIFKHYFSSNGNGYAFDLKDVAEYWHLYSDLMDHWHKLFPNQILDVPYEDLTESPEVWCRKIIEFSGLPWEPACLDFHLNDRAVRTASASQVRKKMYKGSSEAWRKYEAQLQPLIASFRVNRAG